MHARHAAIALPLAVALAACTSTQPCPNLLQECSGSCVDTEGDRANCGTCGNACGAGEGCVAGVCGGEANVACRLRTGGAYVTLGVCGSAVKLWIESREFVARSAENVGGSAPGVPVLALLGGVDCDAQWSWHVNPATARYDPGAPAGVACAVCPSVVEGNPAFLSSVRVWCPTDARVLAVDDRASP